jgi:hypothetical protein
MKKRYSQLFGSSSATAAAPASQPQPEASKGREDNEEAKAERSEAVESMQVDQTEQLMRSEPKEESCPDSELSEKPKLSLLRRSKEQLDLSYEKLRRFSKEKLNELSGNRKPSKDDMQCYLLSHVLYDGQKTIANAKKEPDWLDTLDEDMELEKGMFEDEYIKEMERYLALFDSDDKKSKKKAKKKAKAKKEEPAVKLVTVEVSDLKKKFEMKRNRQPSPDPKLDPKPEPKLDLMVEPSVDRFKGMFEAQKEVDDIQVKKDAPVRRPAGRLLNSDLLKKFDSPEVAEELKRQREKEREERRLQRIAKLEEERRKAEEERKRVEEEFRRLELERLEAIRREEEERVRREEEEKRRKVEEARAKAAFEDMLKSEKEKAAQREKREAATKQQREKNEPAFKKRKVLDRIQVSIS